MNNSQNNFIPKHISAHGIKLLRLSLSSPINSAYEDISWIWLPAQPTESLSPQKAAQCLQIELWSLQSIVNQRYKRLQLRYPPEQFSALHLQYRPAFELLSSPRNRLNWYWQSGLIPELVVDFPITPQRVLSLLQY